MTEIPKKPFRKYYHRRKEDLKLLSVNAFFLTEFANLASRHFLWFVFTPDIYWEFAVLVTLSQYLDDRCMYEII